MPGKSLVRAFALLSGLWCAAVTGPAEACSVVAGYVRPSNFELVQIADAIVIGRVEATAGEDEVRIRVDQALKGAPATEFSTLFAAIGRPVPSDLENLSASNPEGHRGPCNRATFARGGRYLFFLQRAADGSWQQLGFPFSRINEDYRGEDNAWMRTVRRYLALQQGLAPMAQLEALRAMLRSGRDRTGHVLTAAERADIADHLSSLSPWKPTDFLLQAFERLERGEAVALRPDSANQEAGGLDDAAAFLLGEPRPVPVAERHRIRRAILTALAEGRHPDAAPFFERLAQAPGAHVADQAAALRYFAANGQYPRAYRWIEQNMMNLLPRLEAADQRLLIAAVAEVQRGDSYEDGEERWRTDPHAVATWPELALTLHWFQRQSVGADHALPFGDAIGAIPIADFRARPLLTIARADAYDEAVDRWALSELERLSTPAISDDEDQDARFRDDPAMLPLRVLVTSWSEARERALERAFCRGRGWRTLVIAALGQWGDDLYGHGLLARIAAMPDLNDAERDLVIRASFGFAMRDAGPNGPLRWQGLEESPFVMRVRGQPSTASPRPCAG